MARISPSTGEQSARFFSDSGDHRTPECMSNTRPSPDLHGNAPDQSPVALVIIDMINDLEFPEGERMLPAAIAAADRIVELKRRAREAGIPVVYANDNFGRWRSNFRDVVEHTLHDGVRGQPLAERLAPLESDYFVLKPKHSAFFSTTLETLLSYLGTQRLILTGMATDICVMFTAMDAYVRDFGISIPDDCVLAPSPEANDQALAYMMRVLRADTTPSSRIDLGALLAGERAEPAKDR